MRVLEVIVFGSWLVGTAVPRVHAQGGLQRIDKLGVKSHAELAKPADDQAGAIIRRKLASIIIPSIEFHSTTVDDAIEFLRQESRRLDPDPDPQTRGLNIILKLPAVVQASRTNSIALPAGPLSDPPFASTRPRITLAMNHIPLLEALKYVAIQADLKVKVAPYTVSLVPLTEDTDALITAVFRVTPTFINNKNNGSGTSALDQASTFAH